jgi:hypothetical protein
LVQTTGRPHIPLKILEMQWYRLSRIWGDVVLLDSEGRGMVKLLIILLTG